MKIVNLHGFMGEADNKNYKALCSIFAPEDIISPQLQYKDSSPAKLLDILSVLVTPEVGLFVGQSLGGWYADQLSRIFQRPCILTNPCYRPHELKLITESGIGSDFVEQYMSLSAYEKNECAIVLCSDADTVLPDNYDTCLKLSQNVIRVCGSHSTIENLSAELRNSLKKQECDL